MLALLALLHAAPAHAEDCDARAIAAELDEASPASIGKHFAALASCDADAATKRMPKAFGRMIDNEGARKAVVAGLALGGAEAAKAFIDSLDPSETAQVLGHLADNCSEPGVTEFFRQTSESDPDAFYDSGWYRALATCRSEGGLALLSDAMQDPSVQERLVRTQWMSLIETYARAAGPAAFDSLKSLARSLDSEADLVDLIGFFADAARVGSSEGTPEDAAAAVAAIEEVGPKLPGLAVEKARDTLTALGDTGAADRAATWRWPERVEGGRYTYAVVASVQTTCKNGKKRVALHTAQISGMAWPDQLEAKLLDDLTADWSLDASAVCKGSGNVSTAFAREPFADATSRDTWVRETAEALRGPVDGDTRVEVIEHETVSF